MVENGVPSAPTEGLPTGFLAPGQVLGDRYQIRSQLGRGGMGEVWRAFDLKLRVEVALKALRRDLFKDEKRLDLLRREVRAAREVVSPNVCRIFDLIEADGSELVSMEYVDGGTLLEVLQERGPLDLKEAQDIASQFLAGLEAIHKVGLVHRDIKPENIMLTRAGRVVVMDFGLARQGDSGAGTVSGTPAYMAPEQAMGGKVDARADVYSAGVVLAEMVSPEGIKSFESRQSVWEGIHLEPARVPDSPWAPVLERAVAKEPDNRFNSAHTLIRALEDVTLREKDADEVTPYPGLAFFTEADAEYFYGREAEVERMWRSLEQPYLFAIIGPSGAGKSSFLRAGLIPARPQGWSFAVTTPGSAPFVQLVQALVPELSGNTEAIQELVRTDDSDAMVSAIGRWRAQHDQAVLVVDQFEELFTLNSPEVQTRFADLLARLALEADVHVLLSMRDDFLFHCQAFEALRPVFAEITPLGPPVGGALRRALVQPASKCGYRFEDDDLVEEMLAEVEGERGLLPLLAFAVNRLWEERDSEAGLLTREAYERIGGVGGALARHAEEMLERIGEERTPIVRELFRNLMTAQATRAVLDLDELLSVFQSGDRESAAEVLRELVDARLLTTFEVEAEDEETRHRVEIIHESLLTSWPRLVRWQTQDADAAQLRDQLRQAARTWEEHDRARDYLWTGTAFREYRLWRERYSGGLTDIDEAFTTAMISLATRRRRRRRVAAIAGAAMLVAVLVIVTGLWRHSAQQTRLAEASKLITLGHLALADARSNALAYAIAALERADTPEARYLAVKALWAGPPVTVMPLETAALPAAFAPDGSLLVVGCNDGLLHVYPRSGGPPVVLRDFEGDWWPFMPVFSPDARLLISSALRANGEIRLWETETWQMQQALQTAEVVDGAESAFRFRSGGIFDPHESALLSFTFKGNDAPPPSLGDQLVTHRWPLDGGEPEHLGSFSVTTTQSFIPADVSRGLFVVASGNELHLHRLRSLGARPPRIIFRHPGTLEGAGGPVFDASRDRMALCDAEGRLYVWRTDNGDEPLVLEAPPGDPMSTAFSPDGSLLAQASDPLGGVLWDLRGPAGAEPLSLNGNARLGLAFAPDGRWLATAAGTHPLALWPMTEKYCRILRGHDGGIAKIEFAHDGSRLFTQGQTDGTVLAWPLTGNGRQGPVVVHRTGPAFGVGIAVDPHGRFLIVSTLEQSWRVPLDGGPPVPLGVKSNLPSLDGNGRLLATRPDDRSPIVGVLDLETGRRWNLDGPGEGYATSFYFDRDGRLLVQRGGVLSRWDPATATAETLFEDVVYSFPHPDGRIFIMSEGTWWLVNLEDGSRTEFSLHGEPGTWDIDPTGEIIAAGSRDGSALVWSISEQKAHILLGHEGRVDESRVSPDGKWVATHGADQTVRLWPVPDLSKPSLHILPHRKLLAKLKTLTNLRVVPDETSYAGYKIEPDFTAYRGWETVPTW